MLGMSAGDTVFSFRHFIYYHESATNTLVLWQSSIAAFNRLIINLGCIQTGQILLSDTGQIGV